MAVAAIIVNVTNILVQEDCSTLSQKEVCGITGDAVTVNSCTIPQVKQSYVLLIMLP